MTLRTWFGFCLVTVTAVSVAWDAKGHQIIGEIAYRNLTPKAKERADALLKSDPNERYRVLYQATVWADEIKGETREFDAWHYVNFFQGEANEKPLEPNVLSALDAQTKVLKDPAATREQHLVALKWVLHLVGDIHMPLHASSRMVNGVSDRGGNGYLLDQNSRQRNLHSYWDNALTRATVGMNIAQSADSVIKRGTDNKSYPNRVPTAANWTKAREWAMESFQLAKEFLYTTPQNQAPGAKYEQMAQDISSIRAVESGIRLAALLNSLFDPQK